MHTIVSDKISQPEAMACWKHLNSPVSVQNRFLFEHPQPLISKATNDAQSQKMRRPTITM